MAQALLALYYSRKIALEMVILKRLSIGQVSYQKIINWKRYHPRYVIISLLRIVECSISACAILNFRDFRHYPWRCAEQL